MVTRYTRYFFALIVCCTAGGLGAMEIDDFDELPEYTPTEQERQQPITMFLLLESGARGAFGLQVAAVQSERLWQRETLFDGGSSGGRASSEIDEFNHIWKDGPLPQHTPEMFLVFVMPSQFRQHKNGYELLIPKIRRLRSLFNQSKFRNVKLLYRDIVLERDYSDFAAYQEFAQSADVVTENEADDIFGQITNWLRDPLPLVPPLPARHQPTPASVQTSVPLVPVLAPVPAPVAPDTALQQTGQQPVPPQDIHIHQQGRMHPLAIMAGLAVAGGIWYCASSANKNEQKADKINCAVEEVSEQNLVAEALCQTSGPVLDK